jgi:transposase
MQDNISIYTTSKVAKWFLDRAIIILKNWPPYSPDLNPIKYIWWILKRQVYEMFPKITTNRSISEDSRQRLESALQVAWDTLDKESFDVLYKNIPSRIEACITADG